MDRGRSAQGEGGDGIALAAAAGQVFAEAEHRAGRQGDRFAIRGAQ